MFFILSKLHILHILTCKSLFMYIFFFFFRSFSPKKAMPTEDDEHMFKKYEKKCCQKALEKFRKSS